ncbi:nucleoside hydrolase [Gleimia hominis]|uniref:nucleoside hydrolase n=1 Tax=Gleimia hominis TaxID=595468 RepID=UPI000C80BFA6
MRVIIDCDPGNGIPGANVDDGLALTYALAAKELEVAAIWTVFGNTSPEEGAASASKIVQAFVRSSKQDTHIPIRVGSSSPLSGNARALRAKLDAPSQDPSVCTLWGIDGCAERNWDPQTNRRATALQNMAEDLLCAREPTTLVCIGPLTNIARLITNYPQVAAKIKQISLMGGYFKQTSEVDTNFAVDPRAAQVVLSSKIPIWMIPLDVTRTTCLTLQEWREIKQSAHDLTASNLRPRHDERVDSRVPVAGHIAEKISKWLEPWIRYSAQTRPVDGMWIHDLLAVTHLVNPDVLGWSAEPLAVSVLPNGKTIISPTGCPTRIAKSADNRLLVSDWAQTVFGLNTAGNSPGSF